MYHDSSVEELTEWALRQVIKECDEEKGLARIFAYPRKKRAEMALKNLKEIEPSLKIIRDEAEALVDRVSLGNTLADVWFHRQYDMENSPLQQEATLYFGLEKLLERELTKKGKTKFGVRFGLGGFSQIDRFQEMRLTRYPFLEKMSDDEMLDYLTEIKNKLETNDQ